MCKDPTWVMENVRRRQVGTGEAEKGRAPASAFGLCYMEFEAFPARGLNQQRAVRRSAHPMGLKRKTTLIIFLLFALLLVLLLTISRRNILAGFTLLEKKFVIQNITRGRNALENEEKNLEHILIDWARWDDTYAFVQNGSREYLDSNLVDNTFVDLNLDFIAFFSADGELVWGGGFDRQKREQRKLDPGVAAVLARVETKIRKEEKEGGGEASGILMLPHGPALVAMSPILTSDNQGPSRGVLVMGRFFNERETARLRDLARLALGFYDLDAPTLPDIVRKALAMERRQGAFPIIPTDKGKIYGFDIIDDMLGAPALVMEVAIPRDIYKQGLLTVRQNLLALLLIGSIVAVAMSAVMENFVLKRITSLVSQISAVRKDKNAPRKTVVGGADEIAGLSGAINEMLDEVDLAAFELMESEDRYALATKAAKVGVWDWDAITNSFFIDPNLKTMLGYGDDEIDNSFDGWLKLIHRRDRQAFRRAGIRIRRGRDAVFVGEYRVSHKDGSRRWFFVRGDILRDADGEAVRCVGTANDITERKAAEKSIRELTAELITAQENERGRIARELHDNLAQDLSSLKIAGEMLLRNNPRIFEKDGEKAAGLSRLLDRCINTVRDMAYALRPPNLEHLGLKTTLSILCRDFEAASGVRTEFRCTGFDESGPTGEDAINLYRFVQEALNNVKKHAGATKVSVKIVQSHPNLILRVEDNGRGFSPEEEGDRAARRRRMGLRSMEERILLLGGAVRVVSRPGKGAGIIAEVPYVGREENGDQENPDH